MFGERTENHHYMIPAMRMSGELPLDQHTSPNPLQGTKYLFDYIICITLYIRLRNNENITRHTILENNREENLTPFVIGDQMQEM